MFHRNAPLLAVCLFLASAAPAVAQTSLNQKVVDYCAKKRGKKVGDGECSALAHAALRAAGAKTFSDFKDNPKAGDYVWGRSVAVVRPDKALSADGPAPKAGDVMQFRDAEFRGSNYTMMAPHHTAVVLRVAKDRRSVTVLHQNWNDNRTVSELTVRLGDLRKGWVRFYRPVAKTAP